MFQLSFRMNSDSINEYFNQLERVFSCDNGVSSIARKGILSTIQSKENQFTLYK